MTTITFNTPWELCFEKDGTEDIAVIRDADGEQLVTSRPFWRPEGEDPTPPTLAALMLMRAAPDLLKALELAQQALNAFPNFKVGSSGMRSYDIAAIVNRAIIETTTYQCATITGESQESNIHALLAADKKIAVIWSVEDVREIRPDLTVEQAWEVLQCVENEQDSSLGITWDAIRWVAGEMFGNAPEVGDDDDDFEG